MLPASAPAHALGQGRILVPRPLSPGVQSPCVHSGPAWEPGVPGGGPASPSGSRGQASLSPIQEALPSSPCPGPGLCAHGDVIPVPERGPGQSPDHPWQGPTCSLRPLSPEPRTHTRQPTPSLLHTHSGAHLSTVHPRHTPTTPAHTQASHSGTHGATPQAQAHSWVSWPLMEDTSCSPTSSGHGLLSSPSPH